MLVHLPSVVRLSVGIVFLISAAAKLWNPSRFIDGLTDYDILPKPAVWSVGILIICTEAWLCFAHFQGSLLAIAASVGLALCLVFSIPVGINLRRGRNVKCHCFWGSDDELISIRTLFRLLFLSIGESILLLFHQASRHLTLSELIVDLFWAVFVLAACAWLLSAGDLRELLTEMRADAKN